MILTSGISKRMLQMAHLHLVENNCVTLFSNPSTTVYHFEIHLQLYKLIQIWKHRTVVATTMSSSAQVGMTKMKILKPDL